MNSADAFALPDEYRLDVSRAARSLEALAQAEPNAVIVLTMAEFGGGGLEQESDIRLPSEQAAALLGAMGEDQRIAVGERNLVLIRVVRAEDLPPPDENAP